MSEFHLNCGRLEGYLLAKEAPEVVRNALDHIVLYAEKNPSIYAPSKQKAVPLPSVVVKALPQEPESDADEESCITSEKPRKPRKALSPENKAALVKRLAAAREKKLANLVTKKRAERHLRDGYESKN